MKRPLALLFLLSSLLSFARPCIHDEFQKKVLPIPETLEDNASSSDRMLASATDSIRITAYYFLDGFSTRTKTAISEQIIPAAIAYYQAALQIKRYTSPIYLTSSYTQYCADVDPTSDMPSSVSTDLVLLVTAVADTSANYIAAATACYTGGPTGRPLMGHIRFNTAYGFTDDTEFNFRSQIYTTLHEMGHVLGFSSGLYDYYINFNTNAKLGAANVYKTITVNGVSQIVLIMEPLKTKVQNYFGCSDLEGAYIEQQGGSGSAGSHFERRVFMNEFMTASSTIDSRVSEFFLALLEGTGWYVPDYTMAEPMFWGKGKTCDFLRTKCIVSKATSFSDHFCTKLDVDSCTFTNEAYGVCGNTVTNQKSSSLNSNWNYFGSNVVVLDSFADNCPYYFSYSQTECQDASNAAINLYGGEYFGEGSSCFTGTLGNFGVKSTTAPFCFKYTCEGSVGSYQVKVTVGSQTVTCSTAGTKAVSGYDGTLNCPNPETFCATSGATYCPRGCMGRGSCASGVCSCSGDYSGSDCSYTGVMSFSEKKDLYSIDYGGTATDSGTSTSKIIIYAAIGAGAVAVVAVVALIVTKMRRAKARREATRRQEQRRENRQSRQQNRQNNYVVNGNQAPIQQQQANYVDPRGISIGVAQQQQQPVQMYAMPQQQYYANNMNPQMQMQGNMVYYPEANVYQDQHGNIYPGPPQYNGGYPQQVQGQRVQVPR